MGQQAFHLEPIEGTTDHRQKQIDRFSPFRLAAKTKRRKSRRRNQAPQKLIDQTSSVRSVRPAYPAE